MQVNSCATGMAGTMGNNNLSHRRYEHVFLGLTENAAAPPPIDITGEVEIRTVVYREIAPGTTCGIISRVPPSLIKYETTA